MKKNINIPDDLIKAIKKQATKNNRSFVKEVVHVLEENVGIVRGDTLHKQGRC